MSLSYSPVTDEEEDEMFARWQAVFETDRDIGMNDNLGKFGVRQRTEDHFTSSRTKYVELLGDTPPRIELDFASPASYHNSSTILDNTTRTALESFSLLVGDDGPFRPSSHRTRLGRFDIIDDCRSIIGFLR